MRMRQLLVAFLLILMNSQSLFAGRYSRLPSTDGGIWCCFFSDFTLEVAALYWRASRGDKLYAITSENVGFERDLYHTVSPENDWGVRARLGYRLSDCAFAIGEYTHFKDNCRDTTLSPPDVSYFQGQSGVELTIDSVTAKIHSKYQRARGDLGYFLWNGCRGNFYTFGGVSWIYLREKDSMEAASTTTVLRPISLNQSLRFNGAGFEVGFGGRYLICKWLGVAGEFNGIAAIGSHQYQFNTFISNANNQTVENDRPDETLCFPGLDLRLEVFLRWKCFCPIAISVGYEYHHFFDALTGNRLYFGPNNALFPTQYQETNDIGYGGLFISGRLNY